jgi:hypothetical protein
MYSSEGKKECRRIWQKHAEGEVLLLAAPDLSDAISIAKSLHVDTVTVPENNLELYAIKDEMALRLGRRDICVLPDDYINLVGGYDTYIPDLEVGWSQFSRDILIRICRGMRRGDEVKVFFTVCRNPSRTSRFGSSGKFKMLGSKQYYATKYRLLPRVIFDLECTAYLNNCIAEKIPGSIFEYQGTKSTTGHACNAPVMFHLGYKLERILWK